MSTHNGIEYIDKSDRTNKIIERANLGDDDAIFEYAGICYEHFHYCEKIVHVIAIGIFYFIILVIYLVPISQFILPI
jgi:hypothetical protein